MGSWNPTRAKLHEFFYSTAGTPACFSTGNRGDKYMRRPPLASLCFAEKEFYLDEFHEKSVLFALRAADLASETDMHAALEVFETLLRNETRVLLLLKTSNGEGEQRRVMALHKQLTRMVKTPHASPVVFSGAESVDQILSADVGGTARNASICRPVASWGACIISVLCTTECRRAPDVQAGVS